MERTAPSDVTQLLQGWREGDSKALDALLPLVYKELRRLAHFRLRAERPDHTLQSAALVHEAYLQPCRNECPTVGEPDSFLRDSRPVHAPDSCGLRPSSQSRQARGQSLQAVAGGRHGSAPPNGRRRHRLG